MEGSVDPQEDGLRFSAFNSGTPNQDVHSLVSSAPRRNQLHAGFLQDKENLARELWLWNWKEKLQRYKAAITQLKVE